MGHEALFIFTYNIQPNIKLKYKKSSLYYEVKFGFNLLIIIKFVRIESELFNVHISDESS